MAKMVGLSRNINCTWLNKTVELINEGLKPEEIKEQLNEYLSFEISSPTNLRKTREILLTIWVADGELTSKLREKALELFNKYPEYKLEIHWCMMLAAYPVFGDMCKLIGKISEFQDEIVLGQIKQKLFDEWGERTTLYHSIDKLVATLKSFEVLLCNKPGKYTVNERSVSNAEVALFMVYTSMLVDDSGYYSFAELNNSLYLFPFKYSIEKEKIAEDERFIFNNFGGELTVALK